MSQFKIDLLPKQLEIFNSKARFRVVVCGRRFGKSTVTAYIVILHALQTKEGVSWVVAPTYPMTMIMWRMIKRFLPRDYVKEIREGDKSIELVNGHIIYAKSGDNPDSLRGEGLSLVAFDEFAFIKPEVWTEAIRPALADKGGKAIFIGTPCGKTLYYQLYLKGLDDSEPQWESFQYPTFENPLIPLSEIEELKRTLPEEVYRQEILAEFVDGGGEVFKTFERQLKDTFAPFDPTKFYVAGLDLGKHKDFTVLSIVESEHGDTVCQDRYNQIDWEYQSQRIYQKLMEYGNPPCYMDSTGLGDPMYDRLRSMGLNVLSVKISATTKPQLIQNLEIMLNNGERWLPNTKETINEFSVFSYKMSDFGKIKYGAPDGFHDDIVISEALASWGLRKACMTVGIIEEYADSKYEHMEVIGDDSDTRIVEWDEEEQSLRREEQY